MTIKELLNKQLITEAERQELIISRAKAIVTANMPTIPFESCGEEWVAQHPDWDRCISRLDEYLHHQGLYTDDEEKETYQEAYHVLKVIRSSKWYELLHEESCKEYYNQVMDREETKNELRYLP